MKTRWCANGRQTAVGVVCNVFATWALKLYAFVYIVPCVVVLGKRCLVGKMYKTLLPRARVSSLCDGIRR